MSSSKYIYYTDANMVNTSPTIGAMALHRVYLDTLGNLTQSSSNVTLGFQNAGIDLVNYQNSLFVLPGQPLSTSSNPYGYYLSVYPTGASTATSSVSFQLPIGYANGSSYSAGKYIYVLGGMSETGAVTNDIKRVSFNTLGTPQSVSSIGSMPETYVTFNGKVISFTFDNRLWVLRDAATGIAVYSRLLASNGNFAVSSSWESQPTITGYKVKQGSNNAVAFSEDGAFFFLPVESVGNQSTLIVRGKYLTGKILEWWFLTPENLPSLDQATILTKNNDFLYLLGQGTSGSWNWYKAYVPVVGASNYNIPINGTGSIFSTTLNFSLVTLATGGSQSRSVSGLTLAESYSAVAVFEDITYTANQIKPYQVVFPYTKTPNKGTAALTGYSTDDQGVPEVSVSIDGARYTTGGFWISNTSGYWSYQNRILADGYHNLAIRTTDTAGNFTETVSTVLIDNTGPSLVGDYTITYKDMLPITTYDYMSGLKSVRYSFGTAGHILTLANMVTLYNTTYNAYTEYNTGVDTLSLELRTSLGTGTHYMLVSSEDGAGNVTSLNHIFNSNVHLADVTYIVTSKKTIISNDENDAFERDRPGNIVKAGQYQDLVHIEALDGDGFGGSTGGMNGANNRLYFCVYGHYPSQFHGSYDMDFGTYTWRHLTGTGPYYPLNAGEAVGNFFIKKSLNFFLQNFNYGSWDHYQGAISLAFVYVNGLGSLPPVFPTLGTGPVWASTVAGGDSWAQGKGYKIFNICHEGQTKVLTPYNGSSSHVFMYKTTLGNLVDVAYKAATGPTNDITGLANVTIGADYTPIFNLRYLANFPVGTFNENVYPPTFTTYLSTGGYGSDWWIENLDDTSTWRTLGSSNVTLSFNAALPVNTSDNAYWKFYTNFTFGILSIKQGAVDTALTMGRSYTLAAVFKNSYAKAWYSDPYGVYPTGSSADPSLRWPNETSVIPDFTQRISFAIGQGPPRIWPEWTGCPYNTDNGLTPPQCPYTTSTTVTHCDFWDMNFWGVLPVLDPPYYHPDDPVPWCNQLVPLAPGTRYVTAGSVAADLKLYSTYEEP